MLEGQGPMSNIAKCQKPLHWLRTFAPAFFRWAARSPATEASPAATLLMSSAAVLLSGTAGRRNLIGGGHGRCIMLGAVKLVPQGHFSSLGRYKCNPSQQHSNCIHRWQFTTHPASHCAKPSHGFPRSAASQPCYSHSATLEGHTSSMRIMRLTSVIFASC